MFLWLTVNCTKIYQNRNLAASHLFYISIQSINFYTFHCLIFQRSDVWKIWFIKQTENERLFLSTRSSLFSYALLMSRINKKSETSRNHYRASHRRECIKTKQEDHIWRSYLDISFSLLVFTIFYS